MELLAPVDSLLLFTQLKITFIRDRCCHLKISLQTRENILGHQSNAKKSKSLFVVKDRLDGEEVEKAVFKSGTNLEP